MEWTLLLHSPRIDISHRVRALQFQFGKLDKLKIIRNLMSLKLDMIRFIQLL